jgi:uncharacterized protein (DUF427 family)
MFVRDEPDTLEVPEVRAQWNGAVIGESDETREMAGYHYFPRASLRMELLRPSPRTESDLRCPHGVQIFDVIDGDRRAERAAWSYEEPQPTYRLIDHWTGFWRDVDVVP